MSDYPYTADYQQSAYAAFDDFEEDVRSQAEWRLFWLLIIPQILAAGATLVMGLPGLVLPLICLPIMLVTMFNPFVGLTSLFGVLIFDDMLAIYGSSFTLSKLLGIATVLGFAMRGKSMGYSFIPVEPVSRMVMAFVAVMVISIIWSFSPFKSGATAVTPILLCGLVMIGVQMIDRVHRLEIVLAALMCSGAIAGAMLALNLGGITTTVSSAERAVFEGSNANLTGRILVVASVAAAGYMLNGRGRLLKLIAPIAIFLMFVALLKTKSREATLSIVLSLAAGTLMGMRASLGKRLGILFGGLGAGIAAVFLAAALGLFSLDTIFVRWQGGVQGLTRSRTYLFETGLGIWLENPKTIFIGNGHGMFAAAYTEEAGREQRLGHSLGRDAHNQWLKTLGELGAVGGIVLLMLAATLVVVVVRTDRGYGFVSWGILAGFALASMKSSMDQHKINWYGMILIGAIARLYPKSQHPQEDDLLLESYWQVQGQQS